jgi:DNA alkylation repair enzyme
MVKQAGAARQRASSSTATPTRLAKAERERLAHDAIDQILRLRRRGVPGARDVRKRLSALVKSADGADVIAIGAAIAASPAMKENRARWVGWELINKHPTALSKLDLATVEALGAGNSSWDEVDGYGLYIAGAAWVRGLIRDADVRRWAKSDDLWRRRVALVSTVALNTKVHGGSGDTKRTLAIANLLIDDREDMVVKAMSWALRCLVNWDRVAVENFLVEHDGRLAARVKRETRTKLRTGKKNAWRDKR